MYVDLVLTLTAIQLERTMKPTARTKAKGYIEGLLKFETILTAQIFLRIFDHTIFACRQNLQTSGMDLLTAHHLVVGTEDGLKKCVRDFSGIK